MMPLLVVLLVAGLVFVYMRANRNARLAWLAKLDLPGQWHWEQGDGELTLSGEPDRGAFERRDGDKQVRGTWYLRGHTLYLESGGSYETLDLHYFKPGNIGLEDGSGARRIYVKETGNVVPMRRPRH